MFTNVYVYKCVCVCNNSKEKEAINFKVTGVHGLREDTWEDYREEGEGGM